MDRKTLVVIAFHVRDSLQEFIMKYRVQQTLHALAHDQSARDAVLVRKQAQNLLDAFQVNMVF